jgi:hypothetical protein
MAGGLGGLDGATVAPPVGTVNRLGPARAQIPRLRVAVRSARVTITATNRVTPGHSMSVQIIGSK